ncbi:MAG: pro-sigmaK processing inhibitor BofA family protein [Defluviitaleaceae bacterium]|nr:pro-sigmaK processing inhibitor BofA family protein [Defluviitaleaceae bacterium]
MEIFGSQGFIWIIIGLAAVLGILAFNSKIRSGLKWLVRAAVGIIAVILINTVLAPAGMAVGINFITLPVIALLGIPGIVMLYGLQFII